LKSLGQDLDNMHEINHSLVIVATIIYNHEHDYESALRVLRNDDTLEGFVLITENKTCVIYNYKYVILNFL